MGFLDPVAGFGVTFKTMFRKTFTIDYPNGPLRLGDDLTGETRFVGSQAKRGNSGNLELLTTCTELYRPDGELAVRITRTFVFLPAGGSGHNR